VPVNTALTHRLYLRVAETSSCDHSQI